MQSTSSSLTSSEEPIFCIVIGGGIAGVSCVEELCCHLPEKQILILSASPFVKAVSNFRQFGRALESFDVKEVGSGDAFGEFPNVTCVQAVVDKIDFELKVVHTGDGAKYFYQNICLCTGARPNVIFQHKRVIGIRDTQTVEEFQALLKDAKKILVVGNGGIATEIVYELKDLDIVWVIRQKSISSTFVDPGAAEFFLPHLHNKTVPVSGGENEGLLTVTKRWKYGHTTPIDYNNKGPTSHGSALGPDWASDLHKSRIKPFADVEKGRTRQTISVEYECKVVDIMTLDSLTTEERDSLLKKDKDWPIYARLSNGCVHGCDFIVSATIVIPDTGLWTNAEGNQVDSAAAAAIPKIVPNGPAKYWKFTPEISFHKNQRNRNLRFARTANVPDRAHFRALANFHERQKRQLILEQKEIGWQSFCSSLNNRCVTKNLRFTLAVGLDGGIPVNDQMQTSIAGVYAAGDVCTAAWDWAPHWQQMRLWTQARQMGAYAARCIAAHSKADASILDICFDIFTHVTTFFGFKVVLLGKYNGQDIDAERSELLLRVTKGVEFVKVILCDGRVAGAILIGDTDMEETFENLILNQTDVSHLKEDLLNPSVDIEDYFD